MADMTTIRVEARDRAGKGAARATRREGRVPGVLYGDKKSVQLISVDPQELARAVHSPGFFARLLHVELAGQKERVLPRDVQFDPVTDRPLHVDFMRVGVGARIVVAVPIQVVDGEKSPGLKRGGLVNVVRHEIELYCNADAIPEKLIVSLDGCDIGDSVHISRIALPAGTKPVISGRDFTVVTVAAPTVVREELAAAQAAAQAAQAAAEAAAAAGIEAGVAPAEAGTAAPSAGTAAAAAPAAGTAAPAKPGAAPARGGAPAKG